MDLRKCIFTKSDCYKKGTKISPRGIVVHSTGANNPTLKRYVQPDDGILGKNQYNNDWNRSGLDKCVHAFIGKDKDGNIKTYQTLPFNYACWGVAKGKNGSYNYNPTGHIQFEMCEDNLKDEAYFNKIMKEAQEFCAYLCKEYNLSVDTIVSHHESYLKGYGSNHGDCDNWLKKFGKDMNWFREEVKKLLEETKEETKEEKKEEDVYSDLVYVVQKGDTLSKIASKYKTTYQELAKYNGIANPSKISVGQVIKIPQKTTASAPTYTTKTVNAKSGLNVRNKASLLGKKLRTIPNGTKVNVYSTKGLWSKISCNAEEYVYSTYLK